MAYRVGHVLEYVLLRSLTALVGLLPHRAALALAWALAAVARGPARRRLRTAAARVAEVFGGQFDPRARRAVVRRAWRNLFFNAVEVMRIPRLTPARLLRLTRWDDPGGLREYLRAGRGAILAVPHMGNWDLAGVAAPSHGIPVFFMARRQKNPLTDAYLNRLRSQTGVEVVLTDSRSLREVVRRLARGQVLAILPDVRAKRAALDIAFLGGRANLGRGLALFARAAGVPVFPTYCRRTDWTQHVFTSLEPIWPDPAADPDADERRITQLVMERVEPAIRAQPEQYFWFNKRWVLEPLGKSPPDGPPAA